VEEPKIEKMPIKDITIEDGVEQILSAPNMEPYLQLAMAVVTGQDPKEALAVISKVPLENRYVWRIVSALKWAFCDYGNVSVKADRVTLQESDWIKVSQLLQLRPVQFCLFLKALLGEEQMERIMLEAVAMAKQR
jgi:hypothetical protein